MSIDVETTAAELYRAAGTEVTERPGVTALAVRLLGPGAIQERSALQRRAKLVRNAGQIWIQPHLTPEQRTFSIAHELAEWHLSQSGDSSGEREELCNAVAAAIVVPRALLTEALEQLGRDLPKLAELFVTTQSVVALRIGEVTGQPVALVTPRQVSFGGASWQWPEESVLRTYARGDVPHGFERVRLTDEPRRAVLWVTSLR